MARDSGEPPTPEEVHQALECLNDNVLLAGSALAARLPDIAGLHQVDVRAQRMRAFLLQAIEALRPPRRFGFGSQETRLYDVLSLRYVENRTVRQVMQELHISRRQFYRDVTEAGARLVTVVAESARAAASQPTGAAPTAEALVLELARLGDSRGEVDLADLVAESVGLLEPLARRRDVRVAWAGPRRRLLVPGDRTVLKHAVVQLISCAMQAASGAVRLDLRQEGDEAHIVLALATSVAPSPARLADTGQIAASQGGHCLFKVDDPAHCELRLCLPLGRPPCLLLVEDNADTVTLFRRYLSGSPWQVHSVLDPREALAAAAASRPRAVMLDVMMPGMDGWTLLQELRVAPELAGVPLIVCSVVDDPELATALGADACLKKPVSQEQLITALQRVLVEGGR